MNFYCTTEHCSCMGIKQFSSGKAIRCTAHNCEPQDRAVLWLLQMVRRAGGRMRERPVRTRCRLRVGRTWMQRMGEER